MSGIAWVVLALWVIATAVYLWRVWVVYHQNRRIRQENKEWEQFVRTLMKEDG